MDKKTKEIYDAVDWLCQQLTVRPQQFHDLGEDVKLNPVDIEAILFVGGNPDCIVSNLGAYLGVVPTTTSSIVERLVQRKVLNRLRTDANRRIVILRLTEKGDAIYRSLMECRVESFAKSLDRLSSAERNLLSDLLDKLTTSAEPERQVRMA